MSKIVKQATAQEIAQKTAQATAQETAQVMPTGADNYSSALSALANCACKLLIFSAGKRPAKQP